jgi:hypothetical protein
MLLCYGITYEEENVIFALELKLFSIGTINLSKIIQFEKTTYVEIMDTNEKTSISKHGSKVQNT